MLAIAWVRLERRESMTNGTFLDLSALVATSGHLKCSKRAVPLHQRRQGSALDVSREEIKTRCTSQDIATPRVENRALGGQRLSTIKDSKLPIAIE